MKIDTQNYSLESLKFIQQQGSKNHEAVWAGFRELTNKSYTATAVYGGIATKVFSDINTNEFICINSYFLGVLILATILPIIAIFKNLLPTQLSFTGANPNRLVENYFETLEPENQEKELLAFIIEMQIQQIDATRIVIKQRAKRLTLSILFALFTLLCILLIRLF